MAKLTLTDLANLQNEQTAVSAVNANNTAIETAIENTLSRDGTSPNTMAAQLDMNSHKIINVTDGTQDHNAVNLGQVNDLIQDAIDDITNQDIPTFNALSRVWHLDNLGAVGDGVTDDTEAFQTWLQKPAFYDDDGGATLVASPGKTYYINGTGTAGTTGNKVKIIATGAKFVQHGTDDNGAALPLLKGLGLEYCEIDGGEWVGVGASVSYAGDGDPNIFSNPPGTKGLLYFNDSDEDGTGTRNTKLVFKNLDIHDTLTGLSTLDADSVIIDGCKVHNFRRYGILGSGCVNILICNQTHTYDNVEDEGVPGSYGFSASMLGDGESDFTRIVIVDSIFEDNTAWDGVMTHNCSEVIVANCSFRNNRCGVDLGNNGTGSRVKRVIVAGNYFEGASGTDPWDTPTTGGQTKGNGGQILIVGDEDDLYDGSVEEAIITNNIIKSDFKFGHTPDGGTASIRLDRVENIFVQNNMLLDTGVNGSILPYAGIRVLNQTTTDNVVIQNNFLEGYFPAGALRVVGTSAANVINSVKLGYNSFSHVGTPNESILLGPSVGINDFVYDRFTSNTTSGFLPYTTTGTVTITTVRGPEDFEDVNFEDITVDSINGLIITPMTAATLTLDNGHTFRVSNSMTFNTSTSVDGNTYTFPSTTQDIVGRTASQTLTSKTISANNNTISDLETDNFATGIIDTATNLGGVSASDLIIPTQKAVKTYADGIVASQDAMVYKGAIDCSSNPNYPAADAGHTYRISVAGKIGGASGTDVEVGDIVICTTDGTLAGTQAGVGANWNIIQTNIDGAVIGPASAVNNDFVTFDGTTGDLVKDSGLSLDTSTSLGTSDVKIPSQNAVKTYADTKMSGAGTVVAGKIPVWADTTGRLLSDSTRGLPATGSLVGTDDAQTLSNKTLDNTNQIVLQDVFFTLQDQANATKQMQFELSGITAGNTRTFTVPDVSDTLVTLGATQTLTNKTLTSPTINSATMTTPSLGAATATSINKVILGTTPGSTTGTLTIADGKTLTASNTLTLTATDGSTLAVGGGGTLASAAYKATGTSGNTVPLLDGNNTWSGTQSFDDGKLVLKGATSQTLTLKAASTAGNATITFPAADFNFSASGGDGKVVQQSTPGGAFSVDTLDISKIAGLASGVAQFLTDGTSGSADAASRLKSKVLYLLGNNEVGNPGSSNADVSWFMNTTSGDQTITNVGFKPTSVIIYAADGDPASIWSLSFTDSSRSSMAVVSYGGGFTYHNGAALLNEGSSNTQSATVLSYDNDGFTLRWTKTNSPSSNVIKLHAICFR